MNIITIEGLISVKYSFKENIVIQSFFFLNKKNIRKYLTDSRFIVHNKLEEKIKTFSLSNDPNYIFLSRTDDDEKISLEFEILDLSKVKKPLSFHFVVPGFVPYSAGCLYCSYMKEIDDRYFYCEHKQKTLSNKLKNCQFFRQVHGMFKT